MRALRHVFGQVRDENGMTLVELLVASSVSLIVMAAALVLYLTQVTSYDNAERQANAMSQTRGAVDHIARLIRQADAPSETIPPIITAQARLIAFYEDVDRDNSLERVRFYTQGRTVYYGLTEPDVGSSPPTYLNGTERSDPVMTILKSDWTGNIFTYYSNDDPPAVLSSTQTSQIAAVQVELVGAGSGTRNPGRLVARIRTWAKIRSVFNNLD